MDTSENLQERLERLGTQIALAEPAQDQTPLALDMTHELFEKPGLADARVAHDHHALRCATNGAQQVRLQAPCFQFTADERRKAEGQLEALLLPFRGTFQAAMISLAQPIDIGLGFAAFAANRADAMVDYFESSVLLCQRTGVTLHLSFAQVCLALALLKHPTMAVTSGDRAKALLDEAEAWAAAHGANSFNGLNHVARSLLSA